MRFGLLTMRRLRTLQLCYVGTFGKSKHFCGLQKEECMPEFSKTPGTCSDSDYRNSVRSLLALVISWMAFSNY